MPKVGEKEYWLNERKVKLIALQRPGDISSYKAVPLTNVEMFGPHVREDGTRFHVDKYQPGGTELKYVKGLPASFKSSEMFSTQLESGEELIFRYPPTAATCCVLAIPSIDISYIEIEKEKNYAKLYLVKNSERAEVVMGFLNRKNKALPLRKEYFKKVKK